MFGRSQIRSRILLPLLIFCASAAWLPSHASAAASTRLLTKSGAAVLLTALSMFGDSETQTAVLVGNVQMTFDGQTLRADRATLDKKNGKIIAEGNMILASATVYVEGSRAEISYEDSTGLIYDGFVKSGQVLFQGKLIRKIGPDKYEAEQASYTACTTCPPAWSFSGSRIDAEIGSYAYIKSAWFYLGGKPFFWLPYLVVPLKSERQSGVLFPSYEIDGKGYAFGVPVFWAISRSQDLTFTPKYYTLRGWKGLLNYRYIPNEESYGELNAGGLLKDSTFADDKQLRPGDARAGRWFINNEQIYSLPGGFINRAKINLVSDLRYTRDFPLEMKGAGEPALENSLSLTKNTDLLHSSVEVAYYVNQLKQDPLEGNADSVHRFPEIKQSGADRSLFGSRLFFKWDFNYVNFARDDLAFDDVRVGTGLEPPKMVDRTRGRAGDGTIYSGSGTFEPGVDVVRSGQRLDLRPELSAPFRIGQYFDVLPTVAFRHTQYSFNVASPPTSTFDALPTRQYLRTRLAVRTQFSRVYESEDDSSPSDEVRAPAAEADGTVPGIFQALQTPESPKRPERVKHEVEPEIAISGIPWLHQSNSQFFGDSALAPIFVDGQPISNSDFYSSKGIQFDYDDRITLRNVVSALITNRFTKKTWDGDTPVYRQFITVRNGTSYEYDKRDRDTRANYSDIFTIIDARLENLTSNTSIRYFPLHGVFNTSAVARLNDSIGNFFQVSFSQNYLITENVQEAYNFRDENVGFGVGFKARYFVIAAGVNYKPVNYSPLALDLRYKDWSALLNIRPPGNCWGFHVQINHALGEEAAKYEFGFDYDFGGTI